MTVRGWVYVLTNKALPELVKIGFSTKDPILRAKELNGTGLPYPYVVAYDALVYEPYEVEQEAHNFLDLYHEEKEFYRVEVEVAVSAIRAAISMQGKEILIQKEGVVSADDTSFSSGRYKVICPECKSRTTATESLFQCPDCGRLWRSDMCLAPQPKNHKRKNVRH